MKPLLEKKKKIRNELFYIMELSEMTSKNFENLYAEIKSGVDVQIDFSTLKDLNILLNQEEFENIVIMKIRAAELKKLDIENRNSKLQQIIRLLLEPKTTYKLLRYKKSIQPEDDTNIAN